MGQAITWFQEALKRDPSDADSWFWYIAALGYAGMLAEAAEAVKELEATVRKGFSPVDFIATHCPLIELVRAHPGFAAIVETASLRRDAIRSATISR